MHKSMYTCSGASTDCTMMRASNCTQVSSSIASKIMYKSMLPLLVSIYWLLSEKVLVLASIYSWASSLNLAVL